MIHVIAAIELHPGRRAAFLAEFHKLMPDVLAEDGCIQYEPAVDVPTGIGAQLPIRDDVVTVVEKWESIEHLRAHLVAPHMAGYREAVKDMVIGTKLTVLEPA